VRVVLLHGLSNSSRAFDRLIALLDGFDVTAVDLPGHGAKAGQPAKKSVDAIADAVITEIPEPAIILGHSIGGLVATAVAEHRPDLARHVVIVDSPPTVACRRTAARGSERALRTPVLGPLMRRPMSPRMVRTGLQNAFAPGYEVPEVFVEDFLRVRWRSFVDTTNAIDGYLTDQSLHDRVASLTTPTTIVFGELDQRIFLKCLAGFESTDAAVVTIADSGHTPIWETPQRVAAVVRDVARS
jgi:pimeloyl-ACP methyl ester carboxylesterase